MMGHVYNLSIQKDPVSKAKQKQTNKAELLGIGPRLYKQEKTKPPAEAKHKAMLRVPHGEGQKNYTEDLPWNWALKTA